MAFVAAIRLAELEGEQALVELVREHATVSWQAAMALLGTRHPKRWAPQNKVKLDAKVETTGGFKTTGQQVAAMERMLAVLKGLAEEEEE